MQLIQLRTLLKRYGFDDSDPLNEWINAAYFEFLSAHEWMFLEAEATIAHPSGAASFTVPSDFAKIRRLRDTTAKKEVKYRSRDRFYDEVSDPSTTGSPVLFTILNLEGITLWPIPDANITYTVWYQIQPTTLSDSNSNPLIPEQFQYGIVHGAAVYALEAENEEERAQIARTKFEDTIERAITFYANHELGDPEAVVDVMGYGGNY